MPHYKDGAEAKVGDHVTGWPYNTEHPVAGTLVSITPGVESCNAMVRFVEVVPDVAGQALPRPRMARAGGPEVVNGEAHGTAGERFLLFVCEDYCATNELQKIG